jgi:hypothetical protein
MPNINTPFGFRPYNHGVGGTPNRLGRYFLASALAQALFIGDPVVITGTDRFITIATATNQMLGSFQGARFVDAGGNVQFVRNWVSGTVASGLTPGDAGPEALVADDPEQWFQIQVSAVAGLVAADVGQTADFVAGAGNALTGISGFLLDQTTLGASKQCRVVDLVRNPDNAFGQFAKAVVQILKHVYKASNVGL